MHLNMIIHRGSLLKPYKSLSLLIQMSLTHLLNIAKGNDFVNINLHDYQKILFARY
jgi:hypothetical protein